MQALGFAALDGALWTTWVPLGTGVLVTFMVLGLTIIYGRWRGRRQRDASREEDLPWPELLVLLEKLQRERAGAGLPFEKTTDEELAKLLASLPAVPGPAALERPEDREFRVVDGTERRAGRRRWENPIEVHLRSALWARHLHGLVVNRSTGGLGIFSDKEIPRGTLLTIRAVEAPANVPAVGAEVRHCLKVGKGFILGCQFTADVPWNVRVWFG
jgi:hypothetical protein